MEAVRSVGWSDVLTKQDLVAFEQRLTGYGSRLELIEARLERVEVKLDEMSREIRAQTWKLMTLMVAVVGTVVAALRL